MMKLMIFRFHLILLVTISSMALGQVNFPQVHWVEGKKFVLYKVQPKDTWTQLSRKYSVTIAELQMANPSVKDLKIGQSVYVPAVKGSAAEAVAKKEEKIYHTVSKGETLYRISKNYNQSVSDIKKWNNLSSDNVPVGKKLIVGTSEMKVETVVKTEPPPAEAEKKITPEAETPKQAVTTPVAEEPKNIPSEQAVSPTDVIVAPVEEKSDTSGSVEKITETGVATWLNDPELNQNKFYALHRTAPIGTIIKVTNRMNNNSVFVKVVGVLPSTGDNENIIVKITQAAAQRIGALDQKFTAELSYGISR